MNPRAPQSLRAQVGKSIHPEARSRRVSVHRLLAVSFALQLVLLTRESVSVRILLAKLLTSVVVFASACGEVKSAGPDSVDAVDASPQAPDALVSDDVDAGVDAAPERFVRVFHRAGPSGTSVYETVVRAGTAGEAKLLSPAGASSLTVSRDGRTVLYVAGGGLHFVRVSDEGPSPPVKISGVHGAGFVGKVMLRSSGAAAIYAWDDVSGTNSYTKQYYFVDLSGQSLGAPVPLGTGGSVHHGTLSLDDTMFAFQVDGSHGHLYVVDVSGPVPSAALRVSGDRPTNRTVYSTAPVLSPSGDKVAFVSDVLAQGVFELFIVDLSASIPGPREKASGPLVNGGDVRSPGLYSTFAPYGFSPDGRYLAYVADAITDDVNELFVVDVSGAAPAAPKRVSGAMVAGGNIIIPGVLGATAPAFQFSGDGRHMAYLADQNTDSVTELFVTALAEGTPGTVRRVNGALVSGGDVVEVAFLADSSGLAYVADQRVDGVHELFHVDLRQEQPSVARVVNGNLTTGGGISCFVGFDECILPQYVLSSDGHKIAYVADQDVNDRFEVYVSDVSSGVPATAQRLQASVYATSTVYRLAFTSDSSSLVWQSNSSASTYDLWFADLAEATPGPAMKLNAVTSVSEFSLVP